MAGILNRALAIGIGLMILFLIASTLIMPNFSTAWRYCQAREWVGADGGTLTNCTTPYQNANTTFVDNGTGIHTENGRTDPVASDNTEANSFCLNCSVAGGYRPTVQGLVVLAMVLGFVAFAIYFWPKGRGM